MAVTEKWFLEIPASMVAPVRAPNRPMVPHLHQQRPREQAARVARVHQVVPVGAAAMEECQPEAAAPVV